RGREPKEKNAAPADIWSSVSCQHRAEQRTCRQHRRRQTGEPAAPDGGYEFLNDRDIDRVHPGHAKPNKKTTDHQIDPRMLGGQPHTACGDRAVQHVAANCLSSTDLVSCPSPEQSTARLATAPH